MSKRLLSLALAVVLCTAGIISVVVFAANNSDDLSISLQIGNPIMTVNGQKKEIDPGTGTVPVMINNKTLLPVRAIVAQTAEMMK